MAYPRAVLMTPPVFYEVRDVKNEFMRGNVGTVDGEAARAQWNELAQTFRRIGVTVHTLDALSSCEDMVYTANPAFNVRLASGERICVPARMSFASRQPEVDAQRRWFQSNGYRIVDLPLEVERFEGGGDAVMHPGRALLWVAAGPRTDRAAHDALARIVQLPVMSLELTDARFYHLDTCFCAIDETTVMIYPAAFSDRSLALIRRGFERVVEISEAEAIANMACNAAAFFGRSVVLQQGARSAVSALEALGYDVTEVDTGEFLKGGGSVYCMKAYLF